MAVFRIKGDLSAIERALKQEPKLAKAAGVSALNKTLAQAQTAGVRELAKRKALPVRLVKRRTKIQRANARTLVARLIALTAGIPVDQLKYTATPKGGVRASGTRYPHAFAAIVNASRPLVFQRKSYNGERVPRLPIERVKIPIAAQAEEIFKAATSRAVRTKLEAIFERELAFRVARRAANA